MKKLGRKFVTLVAKAVVPLVLKAVVVLLEEIVEEDLNKDGVIGFGRKPDEARSEEAKEEGSEA